MNANTSAGAAIAQELVETVELITPRLMAITDADAERRPAPGKWSPKQIIGHLIDSASNNHQRFVRARWMEDLSFPGYDQDGWVEAQLYQSADWKELVELWRGFNRHLARVIATTPDDVMLKLHNKHNLDRVAFNAVPSGQPTTLAYFMSDYVVHLKHHLKQISGL